MPSFRLTDISEVERNTAGCRKNNKRLFIAAAALLLIGGAFWMLWRPAPVTAFDLQVGQELNVAEPGVLDGGQKAYRNDKRLYAVVVYPDAPYVKLNQTARVYVTEQGGTRVLQDYPIKEHRELVAEEIPLNNEDWPAGTYTVCFERNRILVRQIVVKLEG